MAHTQRGSPAPPKFLVIDGMGTSHKASEALQVDIATISNSSRIYEKA
jgi:hypothetical protein